MLENHTPRSTDEICKPDGTPLYGERMMYERIKKDLEEHYLQWHMFYDLNLNIRASYKSEVQIDFLLICPKGIIVIEVKGGRMHIRNGVYVNTMHGVGSKNLPESPFHQAKRYRNALLEPSNGVYDRKEVFITFACAFPSAHLDRTSVITGDKDKEFLWNAFDHEDESKSFAEFCLKVFEDDKAEKGYQRDDFTPEEINRIIKRLEPTIFATGARRPSSLQEVLDWLQVNDLNVLTGLSKNSRLFIEGGPGTGKTTLAKAYIRMFAPQRGLYLCWNSLLAASMRKELKKADLHYCCDVEKFESFLIRISSGMLSVADFSDGKSPDINVLKEVLVNYKSSNIYKDYAYIIIDEIHDTLDKGAIEVLELLSSIGDAGLKEGRFMVFFDNNQGYNQQSRDLTGLSEAITENAAIFVLGENHRVPENKAIVNYSYDILALNRYDKFLNYIKEFETIPNCPIKVHYCNSEREFQIQVREKAKDIAGKRKGNNNVLLVHSSIMRLNSTKEYLEWQGDNITELTEENVGSNLENTLPWTTILKYKGLERDNVILAIKGEDYFDCFEIFIGMTRTISNLELLILE